MIAHGHGMLDCTFRCEARQGRDPSAQSAQSSKSEIQSTRTAVVILPETRLASLRQLRTVLDARVHGRVSSEIRSDIPYSDRQSDSGCGQCKRTLQETERAARIPDAAQRFHKRTASFIVDASQLLAVSDTALDC